MTSPDLDATGAAEALPALAGPGADERAVRIAGLEALFFLVKAEYERERADAGPLFAELRKKGQRQQEVILPGGEVAGLIAIKEGPTSTEVDEKALLAFVEATNPEGVETYIDPEVLKREDVADVLRSVFPEVVSRRVRVATRAEYLKQAEAAKGWLLNEESGETAKVATYTRHDPTGDFAFADGRKSAARRVAFMKALRTDPGLRAQILGGALALTAGDTTGGTGE